MAIVQLESFDITTAGPTRLLASAGFWSSLPRIARGAAPAARLLMVADTLRPEDVIAGFEQAAAPVDILPPGAQAYRLQYETFLKQTVREIRYMNLYLVIDTDMDDEGLCRLLGGYGVSAMPLAEPVPRPFDAGAERWNHVAASNGTLWRVMRSTRTQVGPLFARSLHKLFSLEFPLWAAMHVYTMQPEEAVRSLRLKAVTARYAPRKTQEEAQEAAEVESAVGQLRYEMNRVGAALHTVRFHVMFGAGSERELGSRERLVAGASPFALETVTPPGEVARKVFSGEAIVDDAGALLTTPGVALLAGSIFSFRRRTETQGILLGADRNQSPVVFNIFDDRNPSYNTVILGQTGAGKTFATLLIMLRHLLMGTRLVIVDPQGAIDLTFLGEEMCHRAVIGTSEASINILDIVHDEIGAQVESVAAMLTMLGVMDYGDTLARAVLDDALMAIYAEGWGTGTPAPTLDAVQVELEDIAGSAELPDVAHTAAMLAFKLGPYVSGSRADLFGKPTTVDFSLRHPVTIYDISRLPLQEQGGNLRSALLAILVADVNQGIRRLRRAGDRDPILFFVDEMGLLMRDPVIASHVSAEYKTARARLVGMIVADQDLHSLLGPADERGLHHGVPMLANAAFTFIFMQKDSEKARIREFFPGLPDAVVEALPALGRGACVALFPDDLLMVNVMPSLFDRVVLSSRLQDRERARQVTEQLVKELYGE